MFGGKRILVSFNAEQNVVGRGQRKNFFQAALFAVSTTVGFAAFFVLWPKNPHQNRPHSTFPANLSGSLSYAFSSQRHQQPTNKQKQNFKPC